MSKDILEIEVRTAKATKDTDKLTKSLDRLEKEGKQVDAQLKKTGKGTSVLQKNFISLKGAIAGAGLAAGFVALGKGIFRVSMEFQKLDAMLITATGSTEGAARAFTSLQEFASSTPYDLQQVTQAFITMKNLGLDPSMQALTDYGNTASAMGRPLNQMIEAVADAATGEFERLKEFGIKAKKQGDDVTFTFRGVEKTIKNDAKSIEGYLQDLSRANFGGSMGRQMDTLGGKVSNLADEWDKAMLAMGKSGVDEAIEWGLEQATDMLENFQATLRNAQWSKEWKAFYDAGLITMWEFYSENGKAQEAHIQQIVRQQYLEEALRSEAAADLQHFVDTEISIQAQANAQLAILHAAKSDELAGAVAHWEGIMAGSIARQNALLDQIGSRTQMGPGREFMNPDNAPGYEPPDKPEPPPTFTPTAFRGGGGGGGMSQEAKDAEKLSTSYTNLYEELNPLVEAAREYAENVNLLNAAQEAGLATADQTALSQATLTQNFAETKEEIQGLTDLTVDWAEITESAISDFAAGFADTLVDGILEGEMAFDEFAKSFLANIAKMILQAQLLAAVNMAMKALGVSTSADGNVVSSGRITPFASGGIVSSPTVFPMASGVGLMGEAGPEAIMPLQRDRKGRLGVSGGVTVNSTVINNAPVTVTQTEEIDQSGNVNVQFLIESAMKDGFSSGRLDKSMTQFGARRVAQ